MLPPSPCGSGPTPRCTASCPTCTAPATCSPPSAIPSTSGRGKTFSTGLVAAATEPGSAPGPSPRPEASMWVAILLVAALMVSAFRMAGAETGGEVFDLLQPGSRPAVGIGGDPFLSPLEDATGWWSE